MCIRDRHQVQPVDGGIGVRPAQAFDEGRDHVVMGIAGLVVTYDPTLEGLFDVGQFDTVTAPAARQRGSHLQGIEGETGVAAGSVCQSHRSFAIKFRPEPPRPRSSSAMARAMTASRSGGVKDSSRNKVEREMSCLLYTSDAAILRV